MAEEERSDYTNMNFLSSVDILISSYVNHRKNMVLKHYQLIQILRRSIRYSKVQVVGSLSKSLNRPL